PTLIRVVWSITWFPPAVLGRRQFVELAWLGAVHDREGLISVTRSSLRPARPRIVCEKIGVRVNPGINLGKGQGERRHREFGDYAVLELHQHTPIRDVPQSIRQDASREVPWTRPAIPPG